MYKFTSWFTIGTIFCAPRLSLSRFSFRRYHIFTNFVFFLFVVVAYGGFLLLCYLCVEIIVRLDGFTSHECVLYGNITRYEHSAGNDCDVTRYFYCHSTTTVQECCSCRTDRYDDDAIQEMSKVRLLGDGVRVRFSGTAETVFEPRTSPRRRSPSPPRLQS